jgi:argininosuccinate lyase
VGLWLAGFAEALIDDAALVQATARWMDACPLGTAAGYGVNLPLDRQGVSDELGFARLLVNPMYAQNSRGKLELQALGALLQALFDVRRFAWDLSLYTTAEFSFVKLPPEYTTGSSIMPNKKNPDVVELLRASPSVVLGAMAEIESLLSLPSGYHRDLQATKGPVVRALAHGIEALGLVPALVQRMELDRARMAEAITPDLYATDAAVELALQGVPFRTAYRQVADGLGELAARKPEESLVARVSPGATADLMLGVLRERLGALAAR